MEPWNELDFHLLETQNKITFLFALAYKQNQVNLTF